MRRFCAVIVMLVLLVAACNDDDSGIAPGSVEGIAGSGTVVVEDRDVSGFDEVSLMGEGTIVITQGGEESLTIETDDNLLQYIETEVVGGTLEIRTQKLIDIDPTDGVTYRLGVNGVSSVGIVGAGIDVGRDSGHR